MKRRLLLLLTTALVAGCSARASQVPARGHVQAGPEAGAAAADRQAFFGDLHLHTAYSFDAYSMMGTRTTPDEAYRFARGEPVTYMGHQVQRPEPLDFTAVTDHSEFMGALNALGDPDSDLSKSDLGALFRKNALAGFVKVFLNGQQKVAMPELHAAEAAKTAWGEEMAAANANYRPGKFTTFIAYEWTSMPKGELNLHRNVIFKGDTAPLPFSSVDSNKPEDLWSYLERVRGQGNEALAIPHNGNASGGLMYDWNDSYGKPISEAYAQRRALNEPLTEIYQNKGSSETIDDLSATDEFANFEKMDKLLTGGPSPHNGSYIRQAEGRGLVIKDKVGANPFKYGFVGATDFHSGLSTGAESGFAGGGFGIDPRTDLPSRERAQKILNPEASTETMVQRSKRDNVGEDLIPDTTFFGSGGTTGVWAEANTRESIYAALRRKETFATSGTRLKIRFFGGWEYGADALAGPNWARAAYAHGTPMGGDLPSRPGAARAPSFLLWAVKDPNGANLDRIQVVKVWLDGGAYREKVFDVALSGNRKVDPRTGKAPAVGDTVDIKAATYKNTIGAGQLSVVWRDPEFKAGTSAVYYARVLEIPTPRWTTILAAKRGLPPPTHGPTTLQERAWSSPIWYDPTAGQHAFNQRTAKPLRGG